MKSLDRKVLRELSRLRAQLLAIGMVMVCGIAVFVAMLSVYAGLGESQQAYYEDRRFADVFAHVARAPRTLEDRIARIPGVAQVQTRIVKEVTIEVEGFGDPIVGRLNSLPDTRGRGLNEVHLLAGRMPAAASEDEIVVSRSFVDSHDLVPGDEIRALINGRRQKLKIVGVGISPEFVYELSTVSLFPDPERYGVFWMLRPALASAFDMESAFNEVSLKLTPRADVREVRARLDILLNPYGGSDSVGRDRQVSHRYLQAEIEQLRSSGVVVPIIFLGVSAFLLNVVFSRIINTQREQIAALKAVGYGDMQIGLHYAKFVFVIVLFGTVFGSLLGALLGQGLAAMYAPYFKFPEVQAGLDPQVLVYGVFVSAAAAAVGTFRSVRSAVRLPPAEAMRARPPSAHGRLFIERIGINVLLSTMGRMTMRNLAERPLRALMTSLGIAFSVAILVVGNFSADSLEYLTWVQFSKTQRDDITILFNAAQPSGAQRSLERMPGVMYVEPFRSVPATLVNGNRRREIGVQGIPRNSDLRHVIDEQLIARELPSEGVVITDQLATILGVQVGDPLRMEVLKGERPSKDIVVAGTVGEFMGLNAYMDLDALNRTMGEGDRVSGAWLLVDERESDALYRELVDTPGIAAVVRKTAALESFESSSADMQLTVRFILLLFASVIAVGVVYNSARITLSERSRELASLRVLGFSKGQVSLILLYEFGVLLLAALPVGCVIGYSLAVMAMVNVDAELYRFPIIIHASTYATASIVVLITGVATALLVRRRINELDLVAVLKSRE